MTKNSCIQLHARTKYMMNRLVLCGRQAGRQASRRSNSYTATARHRRRDTFREEIKNIFVHERKRYKEFGKSLNKKKLYGISLVGAHGNWNQAVACSICPYLLASLLFLFFISNRFLSLDFFFIFILSPVSSCVRLYFAYPVRVLSTRHLSLCLTFCVSRRFLSQNIINFIINFHIFITCGNILYGSREWTRKRMSEQMRT